MRSIVFALPVLLVSLTVSASAMSGDWAWLSDNSNIAATAPTGKTRPETLSADDASTCVAHIKRAQERYGIPNDILLGIGLQETGQRNAKGKLSPWPWAANAAGKGRWFDSKSVGMNWVRDQMNEVTDSVDVGCMQINLRWHPEAFASLEEAFDPSANVDYAARLLVRLRGQVGSWELAAGSYHSFTPKHRQRYLRALREKFRYIESDPGYYEQLASSMQVAPARRSEVSSSRQVRTPMASGPIWSAALTEGESGNRGGSIYSSGKISPLFSN